MKSTAVQGLAMSSERRIVLFGPPLCGKQTLLAACANLQVSELERTTLACGSESMPHLVSRAWLPGPRAELVTIGAAVWNLDAWWALLATSAAVVLMLDSQAVRESADREHANALAMAPSCPRVGCVVWTKDDLVTTHGVEPVNFSTFSPMNADGGWRSAPGHHSNTVIANWPTFSTRFDDRESMFEPIAFLMAALEWTAPSSRE